MKRIMNQLTDRTKLLRCGAFTVLCVALVVILAHNAVAAEVAPPGSSKYVSRLAKKQESLVYMQEDLANVKDLIRLKAKDMEKVKEDQTQQLKSKKLGMKKVYEITPHSSKLVLTTVPLYGPVTPKTSLDKIKKEIENQYKGK